jgi:hypothetical protein
MTRSGFPEIEAYPVIRRRVRHVALPARFHEGLHQQKYAPALAMALILMFISMMWLLAFIAIVAVMAALALVVGTGMIGEMLVDLAIIILKPTNEAELFFS